MNKTLIQKYANLNNEGESTKERSKLLRKQSYNEKTRLLDKIDGKRKKEKKTYDMCRV